MRAGFHDCKRARDSWKACFKSQSLVNEGRFPQVHFKLPYCRLIFSSQSLVNEGRFPHEIIDKDWWGDESSGRNPSLMRAGFHDCKRARDSWKACFKSQSLVNEGRFPQVHFKLPYCRLIFSSQSLVNEGRFPLMEYMVPDIARDMLSQSLVNEGRFPLLQREATEFRSYSGRNPSLMRAGFHIVSSDKRVEFILSVAIPR